MEKRTQVIMSWNIFQVKSFDEVPGPPMYPLIGKVDDTNMILLHSQCQNKYDFTSQCQ